jgi:hypothetical protein
MLRRLPILIPIILLVGIIGEIYFLHRIFTHPAGGWENVPWTNLLSYYLMASTPYLAMLSWYVKVLGSESRVALVFRYSVIITAFGVLFSIIALRQYGHATPLFMLTGLVAQWVAIVRGLVRAKHATSAPIKAKNT